VRPFFCACVLCVFCMTSLAQQGRTDSIASNCNTNVPIALSTIGLCLSLASTPSSIIGLAGALNEERGKRVFGYGVGPGLNMAGGILSGIAIRMLDNRCNASGSDGETSMQRYRVKNLATFGTILGSVGFAGLFLFMNEPSDLTFQIAVPFPIAGSILNSIAEIKALRTGVRMKRQ
jgi:hypothetical protein